MFVLFVLVTTSAFAQFTTFPGLYLPQKNTVLAKCCGMLPPVHKLKTELAPTFLKKLFRHNRLAVRLFYQFGEISRSRI